MKIYFANMFGAKGLQEYLDEKIDILAAYPSFSKKGVIEKPPFCNRLFLDSGAFGKESDKIILSEYIDFIKQNEKVLEVYANLDVIGSAESSYQNQRKIEKKGLNPLPVFHYGSDTYWLYKLIKEYDYIALGGLVPIATDYKTIKSYLNRVWEIIIKEKPGLKVHGFGINNIRLMKAFPWYSVDASSVHVLARYGGIYTPFGTLKINPNVNAKEVAWQRSPEVSKRIIKFVNEIAAPYTYEQCQEQSTEGTLLRCMVSIRYMLKIIEEIHKKKSKFPKFNNRLF